MKDDDLWRQVALAASKWYALPNPLLLSQCGICPISRRADTEEQSSIDHRSVIAFPSALTPRVVRGQDPHNLKGLFFSPLMIRLNYIAQLSTTYLRANIDAKHCRLSHALGTLSILSALMEAVIGRIEDNPFLERCVPSPREVVAAFTYAALHDAFQGPFGHALDSLREKLIVGLHRERRLDKALLDYFCGLAIDNIREPEVKQPRAVVAFSKAVQNNVSVPFDVDITWLLTWLQQAAQNNESGLPEKFVARRREIGWLYDLLEGPLDADRWDYLWRDTLHLGHTHDHDSLREALSSFREEVTVHWDGTRSRLLIGEELAQTLRSSFFALRRNLYRRVYENPEKRIIDGVLVRCIFFAFLAPKAAKAPQTLMNEDYREFLSDLIHVTDGELLVILERASEQIPLVAHLVRELSTYAAVCTLWERPLQEKSYSGVIGLLATEVARSFRYVGVHPPEWIRGILSEGLGNRETITRILAQTTKLLKSPKADISAFGDFSFYALLLHCHLLPTRIERILQFERLTWKLVCHKLQKTSVVEKVIRSIAEATSDAFGRNGAPSRLEDMIDECPPVFVSFPWVAKLAAGPMREVTRDPSVSTLCIRQRSVIAEVNSADLLPAAPSSETYVAVGGYLLYLVRYLTKAERQRFDEAVEWAFDLALASGCCLALPLDLISSDSDNSVLGFLLATHD